MFNPFRRRDATGPLVVQISEPWDFKTGDGGNSVVCDLVRAEGVGDGEQLVMRARSPIESPTREVGTLIVAGSRHVGEPLAGVRRGEVVSASFVLVSTSRETEDLATSIRSGVPLGIGTLRLEASRA